jgi:hypothetical protein
MAAAFLCRKDCLLELWVTVRDHVPMTHNEHLEEFLAICQAMFERMRREGTWPWPDDSTPSQDMVDSSNNPEPV